jgi:hypothetical protein
MFRGPDQSALSRLILGERAKVVKITPVNMGGAENLLFHHAKFSDFPLNEGIETFFGDPKALTHACPDNFQFTTVTKFVHVAFSANKPVADRGNSKQLSTHSFTFR